MSVLASWYIQQENNEKPLVVIIDDVERCCGSVLNDFIVMLRYNGYFASLTTPVSVLTWICYLSFFLSRCMFTFELNFSDLPLDFIWHSFLDTVCYKNYMYKGSSIIIIPESKMYKMLNSYL